MAMARVSSFSQRLLRPIEVTENAARLQGEEIVALCERHHSPKNGPPGGSARPPSTRRKPPSRNLDAIAALPSDARQALLAQASTDFYGKYPQLAAVAMANPGSAIHEGAIRTRMREMVSPRMDVCTTRGRGVPPLRFDLTAMLTTLQLPAPAPAPMKRYEVLSTQSPKSADDGPRAEAGRCSNTAGGQLDATFRMIRF